MTIIIFLVDTSASMNQRTYLGTSLLDVAKAAVETFMKIRSRDPACRMDRYMLLTFEDPPANVKAGWKESHTTFMNELKNLLAVGLTNLGPALKHTFDLLNVNRMQSGVDTYGQGRCPFYLEPAIIISITDGRHLTSNNGIQSELNLPMNNMVPGSELTKEPFRWDQRLFGLVLRIPAVPPLENTSTYIPYAEESPVDAMCEVTGGRSYAISSQRMLNQCIESLVQKCVGGVVINFEKIGPDPPPISEDEKKDSLNLPDEQKRSSTPTPSTFAWQNCRKLIYVQKSAQRGYSVGHWPIPEAFWPDLNSLTLLPRNAHPIVKFSCTPCEPIVIENLPFDKYEMEPSPLTQYILERRQPNIVWQVFVANSAKYSDIGHPFGYLKASSNLSTVNLFVMPYNYPVLLPLLDELFKVHKLKPTQKWRQQFDNYLKTMPIYYASPLRKALARVGVAHLVPDQMDNCLSYSVMAYLKKLKTQAKVEYDRLVASVGSKLPVCEGIRVVQKSQTSVLQRKDFNQIMKSLGGDLKTLSMVRQELTDFNTFTLAVADQNIKRQNYKNPFDIERKQLVEQIRRMRTNFLKASGTHVKLQDQESLHNVPVQQMGNYQDHLKTQPSPLREIEVQPVRLHTFGNPFKVNKNLMIDEADEAMPGQSATRKRQSIDSPPSSPGPRKRKPGPLPKDLPIRRPFTPPPDTTAKKQDVPETNGAISVFGTEIAMEEDSEPIYVDDAVENIFSNHVQENNLSDAESDSSSVALDDVNIPAPLAIRIVATNNNTNGRFNSALSSEHNAKLKIQIIKEVKRPGKNFDPIFDHLGMIQGNVEAKCMFIRDIMNEAERFKRKVLYRMLEQFELAVVKAEVRRQRMGTHNKPPSR